jgi:hypothetical protein
MFSSFCKNCSDLVFGVITCKYIDHTLRAVKKVDKVQGFTGLLLPVSLTFPISQKQENFPFKA